MIDLPDYKRRLSTLESGLDLSEDTGHEVFRDIIGEAFGATPVADLREVARGLHVVGPPRDRDGVVESIALAWASLDVDERGYPAHTDAEVSDLLADIRDQAGAAAAVVGRPEVAEELRRLRSLVDALPR